MLPPLPPRVALSIGDSYPLKELTVSVYERLERLDIAYPDVLYHRLWVSSIGWYLRANLPPASAPIDPISESLAHRERLRGPCAERNVDYEQLSLDLDTLETAVRRPN